MPDNRGWLATQNPLHPTPVWRHLLWNCLLTFAQGKQLVGDTPQRSCLFSSGQSWYAWSLLFTQPHTEHTSCLQCPVAGVGGGSSNLKPCFLFSGKGHSKVPTNPKLPVSDGFVPGLPWALLCHSKPSTPSVSFLLTSSLLAPPGN